MKILNFLKKYKEIWITIAALAVFYVLVWLQGGGCPIRETFGISCPGCGMTRAFLAVLQFDFVSAFEAHPLWFTMPVFAVLLVFFWAKKRHKALLATLYVFAGLMIVVYLYRLIFTDSTVVYFDPKRGEFYRFIEDIFF